MACVSEKINAHGVLTGTPEETDCSEGLCIERILLNWQVNKEYGKAWTNSSNALSRDT